MRAFSLKIFLLTLIICSSIFQVNAVEKIIEIKEVSLKGDILTIRHESLGDIKFKKTILDGPPRFVYDLYNTRISKAYTFNLPGNKDIKAIRVSQFEKDIVRVVCEANSVTALEKIKVEGLGQTLVFKFSVPNVNILDITFEEGDLRINADGALVPRTILLDAPDRLVLDLIGAQLKSTSQAKTITNGSETVRISQFDPSIVRIVFTGVKSQGREVRISNTEKQILVLGEASRAANKSDGLNKKITSIKLLKSNKSETTYLLELDKKVEFKYLRLHDPERLVLDLIDTEFDDSLGFNLQRQTELIKDLRFGIASIGRPITRMVFDLLGKNIVEDISPSITGNGLYVKFTGNADPGAAAKFVTQQAETGALIAPDPRNENAPRVIIDAGHGGYDHGAIYGGHNEKDITIGVASKIEELLKQAGINVFMTRDDDRFVSLAERVEISNSTKADAFVSVHANALVSNPNMEGLQTYYYSNDDLKLAQFLHKNLLDDVGMPDQRIRKANFWVCKYTDSPSVLLELGFMTNSKERDKLTQDGYQNKIAKAVTAGLVKYLEEKK